ncbi:MAG: Arc family DNA-binding protein [Verrucomicrobiaceae bacterium]|nr:MAG: Arc family DNA-binding protein [Verrucomicrobiaceae bacterium]
MTKTPAPSRELDKFILRFPEGMREQLAVAAESSGRSMNAEVIYRLQRFAQIENNLEASKQEFDLLKQVLITTNMAISSQQELIKMLAQSSDKSDTREVLALLGTLPEELTKQLNHFNASLRQVSEQIGRQDPHDLGVEAIQRPSMGNRKSRK